MKRILTLLVACACVWLAHAQNEYYFPKGTAFDPSVPTPSSFFGFEIGQQLVRYDKVVEYFRLLAEKSDRASFQVIGHTYEQRDYVILTVTAPDNLTQLEQIRQNHLRLVEPSGHVSGYDDQKVVIQMGYNVHGGELAGTDAAVLEAYYFTACQDTELQRQLQEAVVFIEPCLNPDGRERAATFYNGFHAEPSVTDPNDIEHSTGFVPHRGNHFFADLNRDWLSLNHPESQARIAFYHQWYPNIYLDYHEQGSESSYYFEPSPVRSTWNHTVPEATYDTLNPLLARYFSKALDEMGALYFTKENYDNISPIYGSTYPDFQGGVGTTLEVGSSRGVAIETAAQGVRSFAYNIRENLRTSIAALKAGVEEKATFLKHQADFFSSGVTEGARLASPYIVFGAENDRNLNRLFLHNLLAHHVDVYRLGEDLTAGNQTFKKGSAYVVPLSQPQYRIARAIFEEHTEFVDSIFMDITAWSLAHGYGIPFVRLKSAPKGELVTQEEPVQPGRVEKQTPYAYLIEYTDYLAPRTLYRLLNQGVRVKAAFKGFSVKTATGTRQFAPGTLLIPVQYQKVDEASLYRLVSASVADTGLTVYAVDGGTSLEGIDLGSDQIVPLRKPDVAILVDQAFNWTEVGEAWQLLGDRFGIPLTKLTTAAALQADLSRYNTLVMVDGNYDNLPEALTDKLRNWVSQGGVLMAVKRAAAWAIDRHLVNYPVPQQETIASAPTQRYDYDTQRLHLGPQRIGGVILRGDLDLSNPLAFGLQQRDIFLMKTGNYLLPAPGNSYATIVQLQSRPLVSGFLTADNQRQLADAPMVTFGHKGKGTVILFGDSPTFRGYWLHTGRLFTNGLFFGNKLRAGGQRFRP